MRVFIIPFDDFGHALTTRPLGRLVRERIETALSTNERVAIDLSKVDLMTSGFADEVFGVLFENMGKETFQKSFSFSFPQNESVKKLLVSLISRAISTRKDRHTNFS